MVFMNKNYLVSVLCFLVFLTGSYANANEILKVQSVRYEITHWQDPSDGKNAWKVFFTLSDGESFSFEAPQHASAEILPTLFVERDVDLVVIQERRMVNNPGRSWFIFENVETGYQFTAQGKQREPLPQLEGENVYRVTDAYLYHENNKVFLSFFIDGEMQDFPFSMEVDDAFSQDYFDDLPLLLIEELPIVFDLDKRYCRQYKFYHPLLDQEVVLTTKWMGGSHKFTVQNMELQIWQYHSHNYEDSSVSGSLTIWLDNNISLNFSGVWRDIFGHDKRERELKVLFLSGDPIEILEEEPLNHKREQMAKYRVKNLRSGLIMPFLGKSMSLDFPP